MCIRDRYLYEAPLAMEREHLAKVVLDCLHLPCPDPDLTDWTEMVDALRSANKDVTIGLVGKYISLHDAYLSVAEALKHGGIASREMCIRDSLYPMTSRAGI